MEETNPYPHRMFKAQARVGDEAQRAGESGTLKQSCVGSWKGGCRGLGPPTCLGCTPIHLSSLPLPLPTTLPASNLTHLQFILDGPSKALLGPKPCPIALRVMSRFPMGARG